MKPIKELEIEEKLAKLRNKWLVSNKKGDWAMCSVYERMAKALKNSLEIFKAENRA